MTDGEHVDDHRGSTKTDRKSEKEREDLLVKESPGKLDVGVLRVPHHGSSSSSTPAFLQAVDPAIAIISCGRDNQYGHPHQETLTALHDLGIRIYRTDENETILIRTDGDTYEVIPEAGKARGPPEKAPVLEQKPEEPAGYVASRRSEVFHYASCSHAQRISPENLVVFQSRDEAVGSGGRPCKT